jgi:hypothetical protein
VSDDIHTSGPSSADISRDAAHAQDNPEDGDGLPLGPDNGFLIDGEDEVEKLRKQAASASAEDKAAPAQADGPLVTAPAPSR